MILIFYCCFLRESSSRQQSGFLHFEARDSSKYEAYWESMGNIISKDRVQLWEAAENTLKQYLWVTNTHTHTLICSQMKNFLFSVFPVESSQRFLSSSLRLRVWSSRTQSCGCCCNNLSTQEYVSVSLCHTVFLNTVYTFINTEDF